jgi:hypothetical protein
MFYIGQKVVCVRTAGWEKYIDITLPKEDAVYTIRGIDVNRTDNDDPVGLWLEEIVNPPRMYTAGFQEASFGHWRFRPIVQRKTDISIFTELLNKQPSLIDA